MPVQGTQRTLGIPSLVPSLLVPSVPGTWEILQPLRPPALQKWTACAPPSGAAVSTPSLEPDPTPAPTQVSRECGPPGMLGRQAGR